MRIRTLNLAVTAWFAVAAVCAVAQAAGPVSQPSARPVVNINTATEVQLCYLPGIGKVLAGRIIASRPYARIDGDESLELVKGIGVKKLEALRPYVTVSGATTATAKIRGAK